MSFVYFLLLTVQMHCILCECYLSQHSRDSNIMIADAKP